MRVLVVGSGAREHALCWRLAQSPQVSEVLAAPGNPGMEAVARRLAVTASDGSALAQAAVRERVDLVVIGPEAPLVQGVADRLRQAGLPVLGPSAAAARIEGSKAWAMDLCHRHGIPAPTARRAAHADEALALVEASPLPVVLKADGLMAGKGVVVALTREEARAAAERLGARGPVVLEEFLEGPEVSAFALCDGRRALPLGLARDHKRLLEGDRGPMTGGMGAYTPLADVEAGQRAQILRLLDDAVRAMAAEGCPFVGFLFAGLMLTPSGPRVLEFNCRLGDPEAQVLLPLLDGDPAPLWLRAAHGDLGAADQVRLLPGAALGVVLATPGYPDAPRAGQAIWGLGEDGQPDGGGALCFHGGSVRDGGWRTVGGRTLTLVGTGPDLGAARAAAYGAVERVGFAQAQWRRDIAGGWSRA